MIARIISAGQEIWHRGVEVISGDGQYLSLSPINGRVTLMPRQHSMRIDVFATEADVADALYDERLEREWNMTAMDEVRR